MAELTPPPPPPSTTTHLTRNGTSRMKRQPSKRLSILTTGSARDDEKYFENCLRDHNDYDQANGISNDAIMRARLSKIQSPRSFFKVPDPFPDPLDFPRPKDEQVKPTNWWRKHLGFMGSCFSRLHTASAHDEQEAIERVRSGKF